MTMTDRRLKRTAIKVAIIVTLASLALVPLGVMFSPFIQAGNHWWPRGVWAPPGGAMSFGPPENPYDTSDLENRLSDASANPSSGSRAGVLRGQKA